MHETQTSCLLAPCRTPILNGETLVERILDEGKPPEKLNVNRLNFSQNIWQPHEFIVRQKQKQIDALYWGFTEPIKAILHCL